MTYCVAVKLNAGLVFLSDSRTNAGLDQISTFRKMIVYEKPGNRFMCLLSAGNLSISQSIREILQSEHLKDPDSDEPITIWNAKSMFDAARVLGQAVRHVHHVLDGQTASGPLDDSNAVRAHTVFDRTLLRVGETVSMKHLLRTQTSQGFGLSTKEPQELSITHVGSGQQYTQPLAWRKTPTGGVSAASSFAIPQGAKLGVYQVELRGGRNDSSFASNAR